MEKDRTIKIGSIIKGYFVFPVAFGVVLLALSIFLFFVNTEAAMYTSGVFIIYLIAAIIFIAVNCRIFTSGLIQFAREYGILEGEFIKGFPIPYAIMTREGDILLYNSKFARISDERPGNANICDIFKEIYPQDLEFEEKEKNISVIYDGRHYRVQIREMKLDKQYLKSRLVVLPKDEMFIYTVFLFDETEIVNMVKDSVDQQMVAVTLYIDNYDEIVHQITDVKRSLMAALVDRAVGAYFQSIEGIVKKVEKDRYFIVFKRKYLSTLQRNKFTLLDEVKKIDVGNEQPITISMGIGVGDSYEKNFEFARQGIELALGRGGDQAVVKDGERIYFYGGKTKQVEKNTRVKARVKTLALREVLLNKDKIVIMGHKMGDPDSFGASCGICRVAKYLGKKAYIIVNDMTNTVKPLYDNFVGDEDYRNVFISSLEAEEIVDDNTALVVVDVNRPSIFECEQLLDYTKTVVLIDHHLQTGDRIEYLALSYIEPTASSACEMVCEILQYIGDSVRLKKAEAEALYAGILIDTNYFSKNTGVRTFEAAAFLRKNGVDVAKVKGLFNDSLEDFKAKAEAINTAEIIADGFVLADCPSEGLKNPTVVAAQVANDLLDIRGIKGSFVVTYLNERVYVSARSIGNVNVQLVMERLGGGGHLNIAGAQLEGVGIREAKNIIKATLRKMIDEGVLYEDGN